MKETLIEMKETLIETIEAYKKGEINKSTMLLILDGFFFIIRRKFKKYIMTPKEKAKDLIEKFTFICRECDYHWNAKQCALIVVNEIIKSNSITGMYDQDFFDSEINYWNEVKQEIEKL